MGGEGHEEVSFSFRNHISVSQPQLRDLFLLLPEINIAKASGPVAEGGNMKWSLRPGGGGVGWGGGTQTSLSRDWLQGNFFVFFFVATFRLLSFTCFLLGARSI